MKKKVFNNELKDKLNHIFYPNNKHQDIPSHQKGSHNHQNLTSPTQKIIYNQNPPQNMERNSSYDVKKRYIKIPSNNNNMQMKQELESKNRQQKSPNNSSLQQHAFKISSEEYFKLKNSNSDKVIKLFKDTKKKEPVHMNNGV